MRSQIHTSSYNTYTKK